MSSQPSTRHASAILLFVYRHVNICMYIHTYIHESFDLYICIQYSGYESFRAYVKHTRTSS